MNNSQSRLDAARVEALAPTPWYRSPLVMLGAIIIVAALIAVIVTSLGGGDDAADDVSDVSTVADATDAAAAPDSGDGAESEAGVAVGSLAFGSPGIPEIAPVFVTGDPLPPVGEGSDAAIGVTAPVVEATSLSSGSVLELGPGQPRIIGFFAHWCPHCQDELPVLHEWLSTADISDEVDFVAVSTATNPDAPNYPPSAWFNAEGWAEPVIVDDENATLLNTFGFGGFPAFIAIDADGVVVDRITGNVGVAGFERLFDSLG